MHITSCGSAAHERLEFHIDYDGEPESRRIWHIGTSVAHNGCLALADGEVLFTHLVRFRTPYASADTKSDTN
jgi:hypothetical protein